MTYSRNLEILRCLVAFLTLAMLLLTGCGGSAESYVAVQPIPIIPVRVVIDLQGNINVEMEGKFLTPIGIISVGANYDPRANFPESECILTVKVNQSATLYDLRRENVNVSLESGYYESIVLQKQEKSCDWLLEAVKIESIDATTQSPLITETPIIVEQSTETPQPETPSDTILEFGQTWRQGGLELTIVKSGWGWGEEWVDEGGGVYSFMLTNLEEYDRNFYLSSENFSAIDNFGRVVPVIPKQNTSIDEYCPTKTVQLPANSTIDLAYELECAQFMAFALTPRIDAGDTLITEIIISVSVSSISNARWRIEIHH